MVSRFTIIWIFFLMLRVAYIILLEILSVWQMFFDTDFGLA